MSWLKNVMLASGGGGLLAQADLLHEGDQIVEEVLLDDLPVVPPGDRAEIDLERLASGRDLLPVGALHGPFHRAGEARDRTGPVAGREEGLVRPVYEVLIRKGLEEV